MEEVKIFNSPQFGEIRTAGTSDQPLFCLADVCKAVGLSNPRSVKTRLEPEDVQLIDLHAVNSSYIAVGNTMANFITESGFYDVLLQSSSPKVRPFKRWVTSEVLPSIRKSGGYISAREDETPEQIMARALVVAQQTLERSKQRVQILESENEHLISENKILAPKASYTDEVLQSTSTYTLTQVAHDLGLRSIHVLTGFLQRHKVLYRQSGQWQPTAKYADKGYFETRTAKFVRSDNTIGTSMSTVVTEQGRAFLHNFFSQCNK